MVDIGQTKTSSWENPKLLAAILDFGHHLAFWHLPITICFSWEPSSLKYHAMHLFYNFLLVTNIMVTLFWWFDKTEKNSEHIGSGKSLNSSSIFVKLVVGQHDLTTISIHFFVKRKKVFCPVILSNLFRTADLNNTKHTHIYSGLFTTMYYYYHDRSTLKNRNKNVLTK